MPSISGAQDSGMIDEKPPKKKLFAALKFTILSVRYMVIGFIPITTKKNAHFLYSNTSIMK